MILQEDALNLSSKIVKNLDDNETKLNSVSLDISLRLSYIVYVRFTKR